MTPFHLRARFKNWLLQRLLGIDASSLAEPPTEDPAPPVDHVTPLPADAPFIGADAAEFLAAPPVRKQPLAAKDLPLEGSVEERLLRYKL